MSAHEKVIAQYRKTALRELIAADGSISFFGVFGVVTITEEGDIFSGQDSLGTCEDVLESFNASQLVRA